MPPRVDIFQNCLVETGLLFPKFWRWESNLTCAQPSFFMGCACILYLAIYNQSIIYYYYWPEGHIKEYKAYNGKLIRSVKSRCFSEKRHLSTSVLWSTWRKEGWASILPRSIFPTTHFSTTSHVHLPWSNTSWAIRLVKGRPSSKAPVL